tara:strand:+ start:3234 stop:3599 length:366 start_codon:yes stop_codon:yes gene_type:complete
MNEKSVVNRAPKRKRYTKACKQKVMAACSQPGASVARVALEHGLNANMLRKCIRLAQCKSADSTPSFVALPVPGHVPAPSRSPVMPTVDPESIRMEIPYRQQSINISLPVVTVRNRPAITP